MGRNHFLIRTKSYCLFCLKQTAPARAHHVPKPKGRRGLLEEEEGNVPKVVSLQRVCHYLRLNTGRIMNDMSRIGHQSELKGVLCEECSELTETFSEITLELEVLQMTLDSLVRKLHDKVKEGAGKKKKELMEKFKKEMLTSPQTRQHYGMVKQLRKETLVKSSLILGKCKPRVILKRLNVLDISTPPLAELNKTEKFEPDPDYFADPVDEDEVQVCDSTPVVSSVQGHYNLSVALDNTVEVELDRKAAAVFQDDDDDDDMNGSPVPAGSPVPSVAQEEKSEDPPPPPFHPGKSHYCKPCNKTFWSNHMKQDHDMVIHRGEKFQCDFCTRSFMFRASWQRHEKEFHNRPRQFRSAKGLVSSFSEETKQKLKQQKTVNLGTEVLYPCGYCPSIFTNLGNRSRHRASFHGHVRGLKGKRKKAEPKSKSGRSGTGTSGGKRARRSKEDTEDEEEEATDKEDDDGDFQIGADAEEEPEPQIPAASPPTTRPPPPKSKPKWRCRICRTAFHRNWERLEHEKIFHGKVQRLLLFLCPLCPSSFKSKPGLLAHQQRDHSQEELEEAQAAAPDPERNFKCEHCFKSFLRRRSLRTHMTKSHFPKAVERKYKCEICPKWFILTSHLARHVRETHLRLNKD